MSKLYTDYNDRYEEESIEQRDYKNVINCIKDGIAVAFPNVNDEVVLIDDDKRIWKYIENDDIPTILWTIFNSISKTSVEFLKNTRSITRTILNTAVLNYEWDKSKAVVNKISEFYNTEKEIDNVHVITLDVSLLDLPKNKYFKNRECLNFLFITFEDEYVTTIFVK